MAGSTRIDQPRGLLKALCDNSRRLAARRFLQRLSPFVVFIGVVNFALFIAGTFYFGGDAWNGKVVEDHCYLWGYHGGTKGYVEVSQRVFAYSKWHVYSVMVTWPVMLLLSVFTQRSESEPQD